MSRSARQVCLPKCIFILIYLDRQGYLELQLLHWDMKHGLESTLRSEMTPILQSAASLQLFLTLMQSRLIRNSMYQMYGWLLYERVQCNSPLRWVDRRGGHE